MIDKTNLSYLRRSLNGETVKTISEKEGLSYCRTAILRRRALTELDKKYVQSGLVSDIYSEEQYQKYTRLCASSFKNKGIICFWLKLCDLEDGVVKTNDILNKDISVLEIRNLSLFKLTINKLDTVGKIVLSTRSELLKINGFYKPDLKELEKELEKHGLALKEE